jgi:hypothetical protein
VHESRLLLREVAGGPDRVVFVPDAASTAASNEAADPADLDSYLPPFISARVAAALRSRGTGTTAYLPWTEP